MSVLGLEFRGALRVIALVAAAAGAGCASSDGPSSAGTSSGGLGRLFASQSTAPTSAPDADDPSPNTTCPPVDVRTGTAAYRVLGTSREDNQTLRFQAIVGETARECRVAFQTMTMKVGVEGRLLAGPTTTSGGADLPLRIAVVREGPTPRPIVSKFVRVPVQLPEGQAQATFIHIEDGLSFPMPPGDEIDAYVVYVGFDSNPPPPEKPKQKPRAKRRAG